jgi:type I restriction enzyme M protein
MLVIPMTSMNNHIENRLWAAADQLWANSPLKPSEYSGPVLGLIFLKYADYKFSKIVSDVSGTYTTSRRRTPSKVDFQSKIGFSLPDKARFSYLKTLPEGMDIGKAINDAMKAIEADNEDLRDVLPKNYQRIDNNTLFELIRALSSLPDDIEGDAFGKIYEYFLGKFAMKEGQKGGEFFTPTSLVRLIVEVIEPFHGRILDPASGSGGMFVQSARFVANHKKVPSAEISMYGIERVTDTIRLAKMNLAVHGLSGDIREANTYYEDPHDSFGKFDFVMANPPFNVSGVDKERIRGDRRFSLGIPTTDNANYLWIQVFYHSLNEKGRSGFVMANSAADARGAELEIRKQLIKSGTVDALISISPNFFYTVTLPCTLWFFDKVKPKSANKNTVLFIDARNIFRQLDRAHRDFDPVQIEFLANIVRLHRGEPIETWCGSEPHLKENFPDNKYRDIAGLCKVASLADIEAQGWSLNPGRYVGVADRVEDDGDFHERLEALNEELERLNAEARVLEERIGENVGKLLIL